MHEEKRSTARRYPHFLVVGAAIGAVVPFAWWAAVNSCSDLQYQNHRSTVPRHSWVATVAPGRSLGQIVALVVVLGLLVASCSRDQPQARTYYESLDLSSPEAAVMRFVTAYAADDFLDVWFVLHRDAQASTWRAFAFFDYGSMVDTTAFDDFEAQWSSELDFRTAESHDRWFAFDQLMLFADANDALLFDLSGEGVENSGEPTEFSVELVDGGEVLVKAEGVGERWYVRGVAYTTPTGDSASWPANTLSE